jgi:hypothetical protein
VNSPRPTPKQRESRNHEVKNDSNKSSKTESLRQFPKQSEFKPKKVEFSFPQQFKPQNKDTENVQNDSFAQKQYEYQRSNLPKLSANKETKLTPTISQTEVKAPRATSSLRKSQKITLPYNSEIDVLSQSISLKLNRQEDDLNEESKTDEPLTIFWYDSIDFEKIEEPEFSFELPVSFKADEPIFFVDGEYFDSSGRSLSSHS